MAPVAKKRRLDQVAEITFDPAAREDYLTGFHKRKLRRIQNARDAAAKKEKEDRVRERRQLREQRKVDLERHVAEVHAELKKMNPESSDAESSTGEGRDGQDDVENSNGVHDTAPEQAAQDEEYIDEDKYTTVTVEAMGSDHSSPGSADDEIHERSIEPKGETLPVVAKKNKSWQRRGVEPKAKKKKFRYESKAERAVSRQKQKSKNHAAKVRRKAG